MRLFLKRPPSKHTVFPSFARKFIDLKLFYISNNQLNSSCLGELIFLQEVFWKQKLMLALTVDWFIMQSCNWLDFVEKYSFSVSDNSASIYLFKVNNRSNRTRCEICSKLTINSPERRHWRRSGVFIVGFEHISRLLLVFLLLTLNMYFLTGEVWNCSI